MANPKVSVCVVTFNQKDFIRECLQSLIEQKVNFEYEIIVGDDCSTDGTSEIIMELAAEHPNLIFPVINKSNVGVVRNLVNIYRLAKGEYIAHMDGDDLALPNKIMKQVDVLDKNPECFICTHDVFKINGESNIVGTTHRVDIGGVHNINDLYLNLPFFAHSSKMFRNDASLPYYDSLPDDTIDFELHIIHARNGGIFHLTENLGAYRVFVGVSSIGARINPMLPKAKMRVYKNLSSDVLKHFDKDRITKAFSDYIFIYAKGSLMFGNISDFKEYIRLSIDLKLSSFAQVFLYCFSFLPDFLIKFMVKFIFLFRN